MSVLCLTRRGRRQGAEALRQQHHQFYSGGGVEGGCELGCEGNAKAEAAYPHVCAGGGREEGAIGPYGWTGEPWGIGPWRYSEPVSNAEGGRWPEGGTFREEEVIGPDAGKGTVGGLGLPAIIPEGHHAAEAAQCSRKPEALQDVVGDASFK